MGTYRTYFSDKCKDSVCVVQTGFVVDNGNDHDGDNDCADVDLLMKASYMDVK